MNDRLMNRKAGQFLLALLLFLPILPSLGVPSTVDAAVQEPGSSEPPPSAKRTAARAMERRASTQWLSDVAERLRILEEHAERAADPSHGAAKPLLRSGESLP
jgi:hypothetical protein